MCVGLGVCVGPQKNQLWKHIDLSGISSQGFTSKHCGRQSWIELFIVSVWLDGAAPPAASIVAVTVVVACSHHK